jgi:hypothetical protein
MYEGQIAALWISETLHGKLPNRPHGVQYRRLAFSVFAFAAITAGSSARLHFDAINLSPSVNQALERLPLKFSNGLKIFGLLPGEQLENLVFQPGTWQPWLLFFRRPITANTLLLLTSNYMVVIQEELGIPQGWVLSYIPRECITEMRNRPLQLCSELIVPLQRENQVAEYRLLLTSDAVEAWRMPWIQN